MLVLTQRRTGCGGGQAFAVAAIILNEDGSEGERFIGRCPIDGQPDKWVAENVLPQMEAIPVNYESYEDLLKAFFAWRKGYKDNDTIELVHMGVPVEARLFLDAHSLGIIGDWDDPYPLVDCSAVPEIYVSVDKYNQQNGVEVDPDEFAGGTHNPLYDSVAAAKAYWHWLHDYSA